MAVFIIPVIIIVKALGLGPKGSLSPAEVNALYKELNSLDRQQDIDNAIQTLIQFHSSMVLLTAAIRDVDGPGGPAPGEYQVPAYSDEEIDKQHLTGLIPESGTAITNLSNINFGNTFTTMILQKVTIGGSSKPLLQWFLEKFQARGLSATFDPADCLKKCYDSTASLQFHSETERHANMALQLLRRLWGIGVKNQLAEVQTWVNQGTTAVPAGSQAWLATELQLPSLDQPQPFAIRFNNSTDDIKWEVSKITIVVETNRRAYLRILGRLTDTPPDGFESLIDTILAQPGQPPTAQQAWKDLLTATYGVLAWQIFQQTALAVEEVKVTFP